MDKVTATKAREAILMTIVVAVEETQPIVVQSNRNSPGNLLNQITAARDLSGDITGLLGAIDAIDRLESRFGEG